MPNCAFPKLLSEHLLKLRLHRLRRRIMSRFSQTTRRVEKKGARTSTGQQLRHKPQISISANSQIHVLILKKQSDVIFGIDSR